MHPRHLRFSALLLLALLPACAQKAPELTSMNTYSTQAETPQDAASLARNAIVRCEPGASCSPSVGMLTAVDNANTLQCTASLIASNIVATNSHCIPHSLKASGSSCKGLVWMNFVPVDGVETQIECERVIYASDISKNTDQPDYAFIKLVSPSTRPILGVSREGLSHNEIFQLQKVDPNGNDSLVSGEQKSVNCKAVYATALAPAYLDPLSPIATITECEVMPGNSGGPILDAQGKVRGLIFARHDMKETENTLKLSPGFELSDNGFVPVNLATNFACLNVGGERGGHNPGCEGLQKRLESFLQSHQTQTEQAEDGSLRALLTQPNQPIFQDFRWKRAVYLAHPDSTEMEYVFVPSCAKESSVKKYENGASFQQPRWSERTSYDQYFRRKKSLVKLESVGSELVLLPGKTGHQILKLSSPGDTYEKEIPFCEPEETR